MQKTTYTIALLFFLLAPSCVLGQAMDLSFLVTRAEASNFEETTRYEELMGFLEAASVSSERLHLTHFGYSVEGRALPLVVYGDVEEASPAAVLSSGKTRVFIQANIHGGEVCGKEALLMLVRALAAGNHTAWADSLVLLIAPIYNADGNEKVSLFNRPGQHGPIGGMGERPNAQGYDLNRDHMKLDAPEARALIRLFNQYDPHLVMDLHTTNGTRHAYHLTYAVPMHPNTDPDLVAFLRDRWIPDVTRAIKKTHGWAYYYYGNLPWRGMNADPGWYTFDYRPRFNNNYVGLRNRFAILSEAYAYATFEERILATLYFVEEVVAFAGAHATEIRSLVSAADGKEVAGSLLALRARPEKSVEKATIVMGETRDEQNPYSGATMRRRVAVERSEVMFEYGTFEATETVRVPMGYLIPAGLSNVLKKLEAHGIHMAPYDGPQARDVQRFRIDSTAVASRTFQGHQERTLFGEYEAAAVTLKEEMVHVPANQPLSRLLFSLLEPRSDDGLLNWGLLDKELEGASYYPIIRLLEDG